MAIKNCWTLAELANAANVSLHGDPEIYITGIATIKNASSNQITFLTNPKYKKYLATTQAGAVILSAAEAELFTGNALIAKNPHVAFAQIASLFEQKTAKTHSIHPTAIIGDNCQIAADVSIGPYCVIEDNVTLASGVVVGAACSIGNGVSIGENSQLDARVTIYHGCQLGCRVFLASGVVIGSDGFSFAQQQGNWIKVPQLGRVVIGDDVDIGANTTIDRGAIDDTVIEQGVKLDNQIQIGHNVHIGAHTAIAGCVGIAGSTSIGKYCLIAGGVGIAGHLTITDKVIISAMTGVGKSINEPGIYSGVGGMLMDNLEWRKLMVKLQRLDHSVERIMTKAWSEKNHTKE